MKQVYIVINYDEVLVSAGDILGVFDSQEKAEDFILKEHPSAAFEIHDLK